VDNSFFENDPNIDQLYQNFLSASKGKNREAYLYYQVFCSTENGRELFDLMLKELDQEIVPSNEAWLHIGKQNYIRYIKKMINAYESNNPGVMNV